MNPPGFITKPQAAQLLGCTVRTVDNYMRQRIVPFYKFHHSIFFKADELLATVSQSRIHQPQPVKIIQATQPVTQ